MIVDKKRVSLGNLTQKLGAIIIKIKNLATQFKEHEKISVVDGSNEEKRLFI